MTAPDQTNAEVSDERLRYAGEQAKAVGWTLDPDYLDKVNWEILEETGYDTTIEVIEAALLRGARSVTSQASEGAVEFQDMEFLKENGEVGDCVRAATASILRIDLAAVPHFVRDHVGHWKGPWADFIEQHGYEVIEVDPRLRPDCDYLACGPTERSVGDGTASHMVVMNWNGLLHDPHPSRKGLTGIDRVYVLAPKSYASPSKRVERLEAALRPFASLAFNYAMLPKDDAQVVCAFANMFITAGDIRRARQVLQGGRS